MRSSRRTNATSAAMPTASGTKVAAARMPKDPALEQPSTMQTAMTLESTNEGTSKWWSERSSGTSRVMNHETAMLSSAMAPVIVKMLRQPSVSVSTPASTGPTAGATETAIDATPIASPRLL